MVVPTTISYADKYENFVMTEDFRKILDSVASDMVIWSLATKNLEKILINGTQ